MIFLILLAPLFLFSSEVEAYTALKYKKDYKKLTEDQKKAIEKEYEKIEDLSDEVDGDIDDTDIYKVRLNMFNIQVWEQKFMKEYEPTEKELKEIYAKNSFKKGKQYKLKTLTLKDKKRAQSILDQLKGKQSKKEKTRLFDFFVKKDSIDTKTKSKNGDLGLVDESKMNPKLRKSISKLKALDVFAVALKDSIQIFYIEDIKQPSKATYKEAKGTLIKIAKKKALREEIKKILE